MLPLNKFHLKDGSIRPRCFLFKVIPAKLTLYPLKKVEKLAIMVAFYD